MMRYTFNNFQWLVYVLTDEKHPQEDYISRPVNFEGAEVLSSDSENERSCPGYRFEMECSKGNSNNNKVSLLVQR